MTGLLRDSTWSFIANWSQQGLTVLVTLVIAAVVGPEGYGLVAISIVLILFMSTMVDQGLIVALIQKKTLEDEHIDSAFWTVIALTLGFAVLALVAAEPWARANDAPKVAAIVHWLVPVLILKGMIVVPMALMKRAARYKDYAVAVNIALFAAGIAALTALALGAGLWAIVVQHTVSEAVQVFLLWRYVNYRPHLRFSPTHFRDLWRISNGAFIGGLGDFARMRADVVVIGFILGPVAVGLFRFAIRIYELVLSLTMRPVAAVVLTYLARVQDQPELVSDQLSRALRLTCTIAVPAFGAMAGLAGPLLALLGPDWAPAAPAVRILALAGVIMVPALFVPQVLNASGSTWLAAFWLWCAATSSAAAYAAAALAVRGAGPAMESAALAIALLAVTIFVAFPLGVKLMNHRFSIPLTNLLNPLFSAAPLGFLSFALTFGISFTSPKAPPLMVLAGGALVSGALVLLVIILFYPELRREYLSPLFNRLGICTFCRSYLRRR